MWSGCYKCAVEEKPKRRTSDPWAKDSSFYKNSKVIGLISLVAGAYIFALAFGGNNCGDCGGKWQPCTAFYVVDEEQGANLHVMSGRPIDSTVLRYRVVSENPLGVEVYRRSTTENGMTEEESRVIVLKPGQNVQCVSIK